eukprot:SAG31_NODE_1386_length_8574_cov_2.055037_9_plen_88_part_00
MRRERLRSEKVVYLPHQTTLIIANCRRLLVQQVIQQQTKLLDESTTEIADLRRELEQHTEEIRRLEAVRCLLAVLTTVTDSISWSLH